MAKMLLGTYSDLKERSTSIILFDISCIRSNTVLKGNDIQLLK